MKLVSFEIDARQGYGVLVDGRRIARLDTLPGAPSDMRAFIAANHPKSWPSIPATEEIPLESVRLLPPVTKPGKILCVANNFREGKPEPDYPLVFTRFAESLTGHDEPILKPAVSDQYDFEGELAVVIGKAGHKIPREEAMGHVAGYSCFNDGSARDWQKHSTQFTPGKNFFRSGSFGPWIVTTDEVKDIASLDLRTTVNGTVKQEISLSKMIFDVAWLVSYFSTFTPLAPGDVIAAGTPSGFGSTRNPPEFLAEGDIVEVRIPGVGTLRNTVVQDSPRAAPGLPGGVPGTSNDVN